MLRLNLQYQCCCVHANLRINKVCGEGNNHFSPRVAPWNLGTKEVVWFS